MEEPLDLREGLNTEEASTLLGIARIVGAVAAVWIYKGNLLYPGEQNPDAQKVADKVTGYIVTGKFN